MFLPPGFSGSLCEVNDDDCASSPCPSSSVCVDGVNSYTCICADDKIGDGCYKGERGGGGGRELVGWGEGGGGGERERVDGVNSSCTDICAIDKICNGCFKVM